jgi:hypothetical protein
VVIVFEGHKSKRLQNTVGHLPHWAQDFCHSMHRASLRLKRDFHEVTLSQRLCQAQQASGHGDGLEFRFRAAAVFEPDSSQDRIS